MIPIHKKKKRNAQHTMAWLFRFGERILCGPFLASKDDALHLSEDVGATHVVNIMPHTDRTTKRGGLPSDTWYSCFWDAREGDKDEGGSQLPPIIVRDAKLPAPPTSPTPEWYLDACARVVVPILRADPRAIVYIHNREGFEQEAVLALLVWQTLSGGSDSFPIDVREWIAASNYERLLDDTQKRTELVELLERNKKGASSKGSLANWVVKTKRVKN
jgi:hypothetical protein